MQLTIRLGSCKGCEEDAEGARWSAYSIKILAFLILLIPYQSIIAQTTNFEKAEKKIAQLANTIIKDSLLENRVAADKELKLVLEKILKEPNSFQYPFDSAQAISMLTPVDSAFRIFTWQLFVDNNTYQYGGILQVNDEAKSVYPLSDISDEIAPYDIEYEVMSPDEWYGALYFNIQAFDTLDQRKYLLFGFDGFQFFHKRKIVEVLSFEESGQPVFGAAVFAKEEEGYEPTTKNRLYAEYDASISTRLNYDPSLDIIIKDHLIQMPGQYRGQGMVNVPDGSYEGYYFEDGLWWYKEKIFDFISEEAPRPKPILGNEKRTIFGKKVEEKGN